MNNELAKIDSEFVYSVDEKVIGTWIDGKQLYQKIIIAEINNSGNVKIAQLEADYFMIKSGRSHRMNRYSNPLSYCENSNYIYCFYDSNTKYVEANVGATAIPTTLTIIIEYTKP